MSFFASSIDPASAEKLEACVRFISIEGAKILLANPGMSVHDAVMEGLRANSDEAFNHFRDCASPEFQRGIDLAFETAAHVAASANAEMARQIQESRVGQEKTEDDVILQMIVDIQTEGNRYFSELRNKGVDTNQARSMTQEHLRPMNAALGDKIREYTTGVSETPAADDGF